MNKQEIMANNLVQHQRYLGLAGVFRQLDGIDYSVIKGEVLSCYIYGRTGCRRSSDVDLLVSRDNLPYVEQVLRANGFDQPQHTRAEHIMLLSASHQDIPFCKTTPLETVYVDVNFDLFWGEYTGKRIAVDRFLADASYIKLHGVWVKAIGKLKAFVQLVLHHYKEMNSVYLLYVHPAITTTMFSDIYLFIKNNADITPQQVAAICDEYGILPYMYYMLYYAERVFGEHRLDRYIRACACQAGVELLDTYGLKETDRKEWKVPFEKRLDTLNLKPYMEGQLLQADVDSIKINRHVFDRKEGVYDNQRGRSGCF